MIKIKITTDEIGASLITLEGHAGAGAPGNDIVCAGVSAVAYGFLYYLIEKYGERFAWNEGRGYLYICAPSDSSEQVRVFISSLCLLAECYPQYIELTQNIAK